MLTLGVPTIVRYDLLKNLVTACEAGTRKPDKYFIVDNGGKLSEKFDRQLFDQIKDRTHVVTPAKNLGVSGSWNLILRECEDYVVISGDDVVPHATPLECLEQAAIDNETRYFFYPAANQDTSFSLFLQKKKIVELIGEYDEQFYPAYYEDNDYNYRMSVSGYHPMAVPGAGYTQVVSGTRAIWRGATSGFLRNRYYYQAKWGNAPGKEKWKTPFGK